jgi:hypothetical protein
MCAYGGSAFALGGMCRSGQANPRNGREKEAKGKIDGCSKSAGSTSATSTPTYSLFVTPSLHSHCDCDSSSLPLLSPATPRAVLANVALASHTFDNTPIYVAAKLRTACLESRT